MEDVQDERKPLDILILAAGLGTRMRSDLAKVLHRLDGVCSDSDTPARRAQTRDRLRVFMRHVFAAIELDELFARFDNLRVLGDREDG